MEFAQDFSFRPVTGIAHLIHFPFPEIANPLGALKDLPGTWAGTGFNTIWRPFNQPGQDRFLELDLTSETLRFDPIAGPIPNRGLLQPDMNMFGLTYMQQVKNSVLNAGIHIEPGIWAAVPQTTNPPVSPTVVRMASIPHGTTMLAQGEAFSLDGPPVIANNNITPFSMANGHLRPFPESNLAQPTQFRSPPAAIVGVTQTMVDNPNSVLQAAIAGQTIKHTTVLRVSTVSTQNVHAGGTANTAFLHGGIAGSNADAARVEATFWIETVQGTQGLPDFLQLQYSQTVMLNFNTLSWPHVSVATLRKVLSLHVLPQFIDPTIPVHLLPPDLHPQPT